MGFIRDMVIEGGARLVGMDPIWFCVTICGGLVVGVIVYTEVVLRKSRAGGSQPLAPK